MVIRCSNINKLSAGKWMNSKMILAEYLGFFSSKLIKGKIPGFRDGTGEGTFHNI